MTINSVRRRGISARNMRRIQNRSRAKGDNHTGGNLDSGGGENNGGGNNADSGGTGAPDANNSGQTDPSAGFWAEPQPEVPANGTPTPSPAPPNQEDAHKTFGAELGNAITALRFDPVFTPEIAEQINAGDLAGANAAFATQAQAAVRQSLVLSARVMERYGESILAQVDAKIQASFGNRDNETTLLDSFPSAADPRVRPMIEGVFNQALKHTKGNRAEAVKMARGMLQFMGKTAADDLGVPPPNREDSFQGDGPSSLVAELLGRGS